MIYLDTTFLVDLQREEAPGSASVFLEQHHTEPLAVSVHALCELETGALLARHPQRERERLHAITADLTIAYPDDRFVDVYARTFVALERRGHRMPAMDLLIAVAALVDRAPLVTRNTRHFKRVPDLDVLGY